MKIAIIIAAIIVCILHLVASLVWKTMAIACAEYLRNNDVSSDNIAEYIPRAIRMALLLFIL